MSRFRLLPSLLLLGALPAGGQEEEVGAPYWISTPPGAGAALHAAAVAVGNQDWAGAARALQTVFDRHSGAFARRPSMTSHYVGARRRALELLASMPEAVRTAYEEIYGGASQEALRQALANASPEGLLDVVRRFEAASAGASALLALADRALLQGRPSETRLLLARLRAAHPGVAGEAAILARAARAAARDHAEDGPPPADWERAGPQEPLARLPRETWPMLAGNRTRNRVAAPVLERAGAPPPRLFDEPDWEIDIDIQPRDYDQPPRPSSGFGTRGPEQMEWDERWREFSPVHPVIARGLAIYHDGRQLTAVNLYTADEKWRHPWETELRPGARTNLGQVFTPAVEGGIVYAALEVPVPYTPQRLQHVPITYYIPGRRLFAVEAESGDVLWSHSDADLEGRPDAELLSRLSITGAPLVRGDRVYAAATKSEGTFHAYVIAVDRHTGRLAFATKISNGQQELNLFGRQLQECVSMPLAEADGVIYVGTNLGVFAAVDALLGTPLWATAYPIQEIPSTYLWFDAPRRWAYFDNGPPVVAGDLVVIAPPDAKHVMALARSDGGIVWDVYHEAPRVGRERLAFDPCRIHGADAERVYLGCRGGVAALWLRDDPERDRRGGGVAWQSAIPPEDAGAGRGLLAADGLYVPTYSGFYRFDPVSGAARQYFPRVGSDAKQAAVNLVFGDGVLLAAGQTRLTARFDGQDVQRLAKAGIEQDPGGVGPRLAAGDIQLATNGISQAIVHYREAAERAAAQGIPTAELRAKEGLHRALLERARRSLEAEPGRAPAEFEAALKAAPTRRALLRARLGLEAALAQRDRPEDAEWRIENLRQLESGHGDERVEGTGRTVRGWALERMAALLVATGQTRRALAELQRLLESDPGGPEGRRASEEIRLVLEREGREEYEPYERRARKLFTAAREAGDLQAIERGLLLYANTEAAADATLELARRLLEAGDPAAASRNLQRFLTERQDSARVPEALFLMVQALHERRSFGPAFATLLRLKKRHGDALVPRDDGARVLARTLVDEWLAREPYPGLARSALRRDLEPPLALRFERHVRTEESIDVADLVGLRPPALRDAVFLRAGTTAIALDPAGGGTIYGIDFAGEEPVGPLAFAGASLVALTESRVLVFDAETGRAVARQPVPARGRGLHLVEQHGQVFVLYREPLPLRRVGVAAIHPGDGNPLWTRVVPTSRSLERVEARFTLAHADRLLLFSEGPVRITVLDATSGAVDNEIVVSDGNDSMLENRPPILLPDGRVLLGLRVPAHVPRRGWDTSYRILMIDPARPADRALLWSWSPPQDGSRRLLFLSVVGQHVVALDEGRGAVCLDLRDGAVAEQRPELPLADDGSPAPYLNPSQPRHDSLLLVLSRPQDGGPARLHSFEVPSLRLKYPPVDLSPTGREQLQVVDSEGVLAVAFVTHGGRQATLQVRLFDPIDGRLLDTVEPDAQDGWYTVKIQNGLLVVTTSANVAYGYGPKK